jgi:hypothetical protein
MQQKAVRAHWSGDLSPGFDGVPSRDSRSRIAAMITIGLIQSSGVLPRRD